MNENLCGIIGINKETGWTSFDVIGKLRGILHLKRLGHSGTLDPMAEGVLPVFVGKATKACDIIPDRKKVYVAGFRLGIETDTQDITGKVISSSDKKADLSEIEKTAVKFTGDILQIPPMYSAVKIGGKKLYELAREGKTVERTPRPVHTDSIEIISYDENSREGKMRVVCEKGTYVRTIIDDMGKSIGTFGTMTSLVRTYSGGIDLNQCHTVREIEKAVAENCLEQMIIPVDKAFEEYERINLSERITKLYRNGVKLRPEQVGKKCADEKIYRVYSPDGDFIGTGKFAGGLFRCHKNLG